MRSSLPDHLGIVALLRLGDDLMSFLRRGGRTNGRPPRASRQPVTAQQSTSPDVSIRPNHHRRSI